MKKITILISGSSGFLGSYLFNYFLENGYRVIAIKRSTSDMKRVDSMSKKAVFYNVDKVTLQTIFERHEIDIVINTATSYGRSENSLLPMLDANLIFGVELLERAVSNNVKAFLNIDTLLNHNVSAYALSKSQFVEWMHLLPRKNTKIINVKIEHMYGPKDNKSGFVGWLINQLKEDVCEVNLTSGIQKRDFIYVSDVVKACETIILNVDEISNNEEFEVGLGSSMQVKNFVEIVYQNISKKKIVRTTLNFGSVKYRANEPMNIVADISKLKELGWSPQVSIEKGISKTIDWQMLPYI
jgi:CDP-paratose synthetase